MANISELQLSLIAIGVAVVMAVILFNWMQQRRYRRGAEEAFGQKHEDVLLRADVSVEQDGRIEPQFGKELLQEPQMEAAGESIAVAEIPPPGPEPSIGPATEITAVERGQVRIDENSAADMVDYMVGIRGETSIADSNLAEVLQRKFDFGKPVRWMGQRNTDAFWEEITAETSGKSGYIGKGGYISLRGYLQLADRAGPVSEVSLSEFRDMAENFATHVKAAVNCPDIHKAYARAVSLDEFCTQVDVMIGINIISKDNSVFTGAKIRVLAEASGFTLGTEGLFHYHDENNTVLFSLGNHEPAPFLLSNIRTLTTHGITFLLDVPKVANGEIVFSQMVHLAGVFTDTLGGLMVDDNRVPLSDSGLRKIKHQLIAIQSMMLARDIPAGGETALRLFA